MEFQEYLAQLSDGSTRLQVSALQQLSQLSSQQAKLFERAWPRIDVRRRRRVVQELIDLVEDNVELSFDAVFTLGLHDDDADVRLESIRGLWENEDPTLVQTFADALRRDPDAGVRAEAALALGRFVLLFEQGSVRERYFQQAEAALKDTIADKDEVEEVRARAIEAAGAHDAPWVRQAVREAYESATRRLKVSAVHAMGRSCEPRWLPLLGRELTNEEAEVRYEAAFACGLLGEPEAIPHLLPLLTDNDAEVRQAAVTALGEIGGAAAKNALLALLDGDSEAMREAAKAALNEIEFEEDPLGFRFRS